LKLRAAFATGSQHNKKIVASGSSGCGLPYDLHLGVVQTASGWVIKLSLESILSLASLDPFHLKTSILLLIGSYPNHIVHIHHLVSSCRAILLPLATAASNALYCDNNLLSNELQNNGSTKPGRPCNREFDRRAGGRRFSIEMNPVMVASAPRFLRTNVLILLAARTPRSARCWPCGKHEPNRIQPPASGSGRSAVHC